MGSGNPDFGGEVKDQYVPTFLKTASKFDNTKLVFAASFYIVAYHLSHNLTIVPYFQ
jgi:hypothetical protein